MSKTNKVIQAIQSSLINKFLAEDYICSPELQLFKWSGRHYIKQDPDLTSTIAGLLREAEQPVLSNQVEQISKGILMSLKGLTWKHSFLAQETDLISFVNGTISRKKFLSDEQTFPTKPNKEEFCTFSTAISIKTEYDLNRLEQCLLGMFGSQEKLIEFGLFAKAVLLGDVSHGRALFLFGGPGTGKSSLANILAGLVPVDNRSAVGVDQLGAHNSEYYLADLQHSLLNVGGEISKPTAKAVATIKRLTGGDEVIARPIRGEPIKFHSRANLLFFANEQFGRGGDNSGAIDDRIRVLTIEKRVRDTQHQIKDFAGYFIKEFGDDFASWALNLKGEFGKSSLYCVENDKGMDEDIYYSFAREYLENESGLWAIDEVVELWKKSEGRVITSKKISQELERLGWANAGRKTIFGVKRTMYRAPVDFFSKAGPSLKDRVSLQPQEASPVTPQALVVARATSTTPKPVEAVSSSSEGLNEAVKANAAARLEEILKKNSVLNPKALEMSYR